MAEESSSGSSGSPGPGDTLPWNLAKHQRSKRTKAATGNGTVLDPAERAVIRIAGRAGGGHRAGGLVSRREAARDVARRGSLRAVVVGSAPAAPTQLPGGTRGSLGTWRLCAVMSVPGCGTDRLAEGVLERPCVLGGPGAVPGQDGDAGEGQMPRNPLRCVPMAPGSPRRGRGGAGGAPPGPGGSQGRAGEGLVCRRWGRWPGCAGGIQRAAGQLWGDAVGCLGGPVPWGHKCDWEHRAALGNP